MPIARGRLDPAMETERFLEDLVNARGIRVLPITAAIATPALKLSCFMLSIGARYPLD